MRSIKLLAALAVPAMFAACTQEDLFKTDNTPQQMEEIVGAKLVGTDVSLNATKGGEQTRMTINGAWETTDLLGLGWLVTTGPAEDQSEDKAPSKSDLFANHMFSYDETAGAFTSKGNIYEGWYFAYYPWSYEKKAGVKFFDVNPAQTSEDVADRMSQGLHISNLQFVSADALTEDNSLDKPFQMYGAVSYLQIRTTPVGEFAGEGKLANNTIQSVTVNVGEDNAIFAKRLRFAAKNITAYDAEKTEAENIAGVMNFTKVLIPVDENNDAEKGYNSEITTNVAGANISVSKPNTRLITIVVPATASLEKEDISIEVAIGGGKFVIEYVEGAAEGSDADFNNAAIEALVAAYATDGKLTATGNVQTLNVKLYGDIFVTDFSNIENIDMWNEAVELVNNLGRATENFHVVGNILFNDTILMPTTCKLTVSAEDDVRLYFDEGEFHGWPENLTTSGNVKLTVSNDATVYYANELPKTSSLINEGELVIGKEGRAGEGVLVVGPSTGTLTNKGTIKLSKYAKAQNVDNAGGRIEVIYGSYVDIKNGDSALEGEIAYIVTEDDAKKPVRIQNVINTTENEAGHALANVLVFDNENLAAFDFTTAGSTIEGEDDPYNPTDDEVVDASTLQGLARVSLEINGVNVGSTETVTVKSVKMNGNANLTNINVINALNATGSGTIETGTVGSVAIVAGNYTINAGAIEGDINAEGENYFNVGTITGDVVLTNTSMSATNISNAAITGNVELKGGEFLLENVNVIGDVTVTSGTVKMLNVNISGTLTNNGTVVVDGETAAIERIDNMGTLNANTNVTVSTITVNKNSSVTVADEKTVWYTTPKSEGGYIQKGTTTGSVEYKGADKVLEEFKAAIAAGGEVTLVANVTINEPLTINGNVVLNLNGKTLTTGTTNSTDDITIKEGVSLTLKNGTIKTANTAILNQGGNVELESCTIEATGDGVAVAGVKGNVTANGVTVTSVGQAFYIEEAAMSLTGCEVNLSEAHTAVYAKKAKLVINGGSYTGVTDENSHDVPYVIGVMDASTATINATVSGGNGGVAVHGGSTVEFTGGSYSGNKACGLYVKGNSTAVTYANGCIFFGPEENIRTIEGGSATSK